MSFVEIRSLAKRFEKTSVFEGIDLDVEKGEICVLVGPSGCGKTTLLRSIAGLVSPDSGTIGIAGKDVTRLAPQQRGIAMVFQQYALFPNMTVEQNLAFGLEQQRLAPLEIRRRVAAMIELMGLGERAKARPARLSGGQKQRVALARALVLEPALLLLDEPMAALDAQIRKRLRDELKRLQRDVGFTAVFVTHDQEEALVLGDRIAVMQAGRFAQVGTPVEIYNRPASESVARFIGDFNIVDAGAVTTLFGRKAPNGWAIHPESIDIDQPGQPVPDGHVATEARITSVHMLGSIIRYSVEAGGQALRVDTLNRPSTAPRQTGERVQLRVADANLRELAG